MALRKGRSRVEERPVTKTLEKHAELLNQKEHNLNSLVVACDRSITKLSDDTKKNIEQLRRQRDEQLKEIIKQYNGLECRVADSSKQVVCEMSGYMEEVLIPQKCKIERASHLVKKTLNAHLQQGDVSLGKGVETSLNKILNAELPELQLSSLAELRQTGMKHRQAEVALVEPRSQCLQPPISPCGHGDETEPSDIEEETEQPTTEEVTNQHETKEEVEQPTCTTEEITDQCETEDEAQKSDTEQVADPCDGEQETEDELEQPTCTTEEITDQCETTEDEAQKSDTEQVADPCDGEQETEDESEKECSTESYTNAEMDEVTVKHLEQKPSKAAREEVQSAPVLDSLMVSISKVVAQTKIPGIASHVAHAGNDIYIVESITPAVYKMDKCCTLQRHIAIDPLLTIVGLTTWNDHIYVQYMDVTEYRRVIHVYKNTGALLKKCNAPNLLGANLAIVNGNVVVASRDKLTVCSPAMKHIKDICLARRCARRLSAMVDSDSIIVSSCSTNSIIKLDIESEKICWTNISIIAPAAVACDRFGRVYVLVKPSDVHVLDGETGELITKTTLPNCDGIAEDLCVTNNGLLIAAFNHRGIRCNSESYIVTNTYRIEDVC